MIKTILHLSIDPVIYRRRVLNQIETAVALGWKAVAVTCGPVISPDPDFGIHYIAQPFRRGPLRFLHFNFKALQFVKKYQPDVIHARGLWVLPAVLMAARTQKFRLVYDAHEFFAGHALFRKHLWRRLTWLKLEKWAVRKTDLLLTVSEPLADLYRRQYPVLKKAEVIRSLPKLDNALYETAKKEHKNIKLAFHGYYLEGRGLRQLIDALALLKDYSFELHLTGQGPLEKALRQQVDNNGLAGRVHFHPFVQSDKLLSKIYQADLGIALIEADSTNRRYALPNKFFEYIHAGLPVLASNIPTLKDYINKYNTGYIADPYNMEDLVNTLRYIFENSTELQAVRRRCIIAAKELCWQNESKKLAALYGQLD